MKIAYYNYIQNINCFHTLSHKISIKSGCWCDFFSLLISWYPINKLKQSRLCHYQYYQYVGIQQKNNSWLIMRSVNFTSTLQVYNLQVFLSEVASFNLIIFCIEILFIFFFLIKNFESSSYTTSYLDIHFFGMVY